MALALVAVATLTLPPVSGAGTIEVNEFQAPPRAPFGGAELYLHDDGAENNSFSLAITGPTVPAYYTIEVVDNASPLAAGKGCQGGGSPGTPVTCLLHEPVEACVEDCGGDCGHFSPGAGWLTSLRIHLGRRQQLPADQWLHQQ